MKFVFGFLIGLIIWGVIPMFALADCSANYEQAVHVLQLTQEKIQKKEHPNPDAFALEFQTIVEKLQSDKCGTELKNLLHYIQEEQKKYPMDATGKTKPAPIMD